MNEAEDAKPRPLCPLLLMAQAISGSPGMVTDCRAEKCAWWDSSADACAILAVTQPERELPEPSTRLIEIITQVWDNMKREES